MEIFITNSHKQIPIIEKKFRTKLQRSMDHFSQKKLEAFHHQCHHQRHAQNDHDTLVISGEKFVMSNDNKF